MFLDRRPRVAVSCNVTFELAPPLRQRSLQQTDPGTARQSFG